MDPAAAEKCCECFEDITEDEGKAVLKEARNWQKYQQDNKTPYGQESGQDPNDPAPTKMDCSYFVQKALGPSLLGHMYKKTIRKKIDGKLQDLPSPERLSTLLLDGNCYFKRLKPGEAPRAGDLVAQPRNDGAPGSMHVGVATGTSGEGGVGHQGIAMGNKGATLGWWGVEKGEGKIGCCDNHEQLQVYRPQKCKPGCGDCRP
jgi:hypothetical protein